MIKVGQVRLTESLSREEYHLDRPDPIICLTHNGDAILIFKKVPKSPSDQGVIIDE